MSEIEGTGIDSRVMGDARRQLAVAVRRLQHIEAMARTGEYTGAENRCLLVEAVASIHAALARLDVQPPAAAGDDGRDNGAPFVDDRDSGDRGPDPERCAVCGGFLGDHGVCVTVGCEGSERGER